MENGVDNIATVANVPPQILPIKQLPSPGPPRVGSILFSLFLPTDFPILIPDWLISSHVT